MRSSCWVSRTKPTSLESTPDSPQTSCSSALQKSSSVRSSAFASALTSYGRRHPADFRSRPSCASTRLRTRTDRRSGIAQTVSHNSRRQLHHNHSFLFEDHPPLSSSSVNPSLWCKPDFRSLQNQHHPLVIQECSSLTTSARRCPHFSRNDAPQELCTFNRR